jgi:signal transduction histidine kinase
MLDAEVRELNNESLIAQIEELDKLNDSALGIARSLTVELSPPVLEGEGLPEAFSWLAGHMESAYALQVAVSVEEDIRFENKDLYELVFQIVRELLFNVVKHADVQNSRLIMRRRAAQCLIAVQDDGKGFDISRVGGENGSASSYGLQRIHERLELFNGSLQIESEPGLGTSVTICLPCSEAKKHENP